MRVALIFYVDGLELVHEACLGGRIERMGWVELVEGETWHCAICFQPLLPANASGAPKIDEQPRC